MKSETEKPITGTRVSVSDLVIDLHNAMVYRDGEPITLPDLSLRLLLCLVRHAPREVSKDQLIESVWQGVVVSDETLAQRVRLLRRALETEGGPEYIQAVRNRGYRLAVPVSGAGRRRRPRTRALVALAVLVVLAAGIARFAGHEDAQGHAALAVLPFENLSAGEDFNWFAEGLHEELISRLSTVEAFGVISRTSVMPYAGSAMGIPEIADRLGADLVIEGSVRRSGEQLRFTMQLIDARSDRHLWAQSYDRAWSVDKLLQIQSGVAEAVADAIAYRLSGEDRSRLVRLPTAHIEAYDLYLLGRNRTFSATQRDLDVAVDLLQRAVAIDPAFAEAWATLGWAYSFQGSPYGDTRPGQAYERARSAALRALSLNPDLADAHSLHADILAWYDWDWPAAEAEYRAARSLDRDNVLGYALFLSIHERHAEAVQLVQGLVERVPGDPWVRVNAAWRYLNARDYDRAIEQARAAAGHADADSVEAWALMSSGRPEAAVVLLQATAARRPDDPAALSDLAIALVRSGDEAGARTQLERLLLRSEQGYVSPSAVAAVYLELGEAEAGFGWLNRALEARDRGLIFLQVDHVLDPWRDDPRYLALAKALGFG